MHRDELMVVEIMMEIGYTHLVIILAIECQ